MMDTTSPSGFEVYGSIENLVHLPPMSYVTQMLHKHEESQPAFLDKPQF